MKRQVKCTKTFFPSIHVALTGCDTTGISFQKMVWIYMHFEKLVMARAFEGIAIR